MEKAIISGGSILRSCGFFAYPISASGWGRGDIFLPLGLAKKSSGRGYGFAAAHTGFRISRRDHVDAPVSVVLPLFLGESHRGQEQFIRGRTVVLVFGPLGKAPWTTTAVCLHRYQTLTFSGVDRADDTGVSFVYQPQGDPFLVSHDGDHDYARGVGNGRLRKHVARSLENCTFPPVGLGTGDGYVLAYIGVVGIGISRLVAFFWNTDCV